MSEVRTHDALMVLYAAFPNTEWSEATQAVYAKYLADIPVDDLRTVIAQAIATCKFPPTIAEIRDTWHNLQNVGRLTWADAWDAVQREIRRIGSYSQPRFDDELTERTVKAMGWKALCASDNPGTDRAQFRDMYNAMAARDETAQKLLPQARELAERNGGGGGLVAMRRLLGANGGGE